MGGSQPRAQATSQDHHSPSAAPSGTPTGRAKQAASATGIAASARPRLASHSVSPTRASPRDSA